MKKAVTVQTIQDYINKLAEKRFLGDLNDALSCFENNPVLKNLKINTGGEGLFLTSAGRVAQNNCLTRAGYTAVQAFVHLESTTNIAEVKEKLLADYIEQESASFIAKVMESPEDYPF